jgi:hypothetical protein
VLTANLRTSAYLAVGQALQRACPGGSLMSSEIGALGWVFHGRIIDGAGLVSPEVLPFHPLQVPAQRPSGNVGAVPARAIAVLRPDLVVGMELFLGDFLAQRQTQTLRGAYGLALRTPVLDPALGRTRLWSSRWVQAFVRSGACGNSLPPIPE